MVHILQPECTLYHQSTTSKHWRKLSTDAIQGNGPLASSFLHMSPDCRGNPRCSFYIDCPISVSKMHQNKAMTLTMQACDSFWCWHCFLVSCSRDTYQDQEEDQALSGLAAAVTLKSRGVTYKVYIIYLHLQYVHLLCCWSRRNLQPFTRVSLLCFACRYSTSFAYALHACVFA